MNELIKYTGIFLCSVFISSISQIMLKQSTNKTYESRLKEYLNPLVMFSYILFFSSSLLTTLAYKGIPLSMGFVLESSGYVYIAILGTTILKERMTRKKIIGNVLIIFGILIYNLF